VENVWLASALWLGLALLASIISIRMATSVALIEIMVGAVAGNTIGLTLTPWVNFLAGFGAILLTFLAGTEIDGRFIRKHFRSSIGIGVVGFLAPYLGVLLYAHYVAGWSWPQAQIAGISLSTTSVAVVYAVMIETGFNKTEIGKIILAACFVNDLGTVLALGIVFAHFDLWLALFGAATAVALWLLPRFAPWFFGKVGRGVSEPETKFVSLVLLSLGGMATIAGSEAVLPAYLVGMALAPAFLSDPGAAAPDANHRLHDSHTLLFPQGRLPRRCPGGDCRGRADPRLPRDQDGDQIRRHPAPHEGVPLRGEGGHVHDAPDVHGPDLRHDLGPVRAHQPDHRPGAIHDPGHGRDRQRRGADPDRPEVVPADFQADRHGTGDPASRGAAECIGRS
jgi:hypothetical protein